MMIVGMMMRLWLLHLMMMTERNGLMMVMMKSMMGLMMRDRVHLVMRAEKATRDYVVHAHVVAHSGCSRERRGQRECEGGGGRGRIGRVVWRVGRSL